MAAARRGPGEGIFDGTALGSLAAFLSLTEILVRWGWLYPSHLSLPLRCLKSQPATPRPRRAKRPRVAGRQAGSWREAQECPPPQHVNAVQTSSPSSS